MNPNRVVRLLLMSIVVQLLPLCVYAGNQHEFRAGKLLDVSSDDRVVEGNSIKYAIYEVQVGDIIYFGRGERMRRHSGDPGHGLIVGDPVQAAVEGDNLILQRPDGKDIKTKIVRRQRAESAK